MSTELRVASTRAQSLLPVVTREQRRDDVAPGFPARVPGLEVALDAAAQEWPPDAQIAQLLDAGVRVIGVNGVVALGANSPEETIRFIRFLRDATSRLMVVRWTASVDLPEDESTLSHLTPPAEAADTNVIDRWKGRHRYASFHWRQGPGFVLVKDARPGRPVARYAIDGDIDLEAFHRLQAVCRRSALPTRLATSVNGLVEAGLAMELDDWLTLLPTRIRLWPVPFTAV
jgi:hypothetical protein